MVTWVTVLLALSGWGKVAYDYLSGQPLVRGQIFNVIRGEMDNPQGPGWLAAFVTFLYLTNARRAPVHVLDYELDTALYRAGVSKVSPRERSKADESAVERR
jgi:hypothetical protein